MSISIVVQAKRRRGRRVTVGLHFPSNRVIELADYRELEEKIKNNIVPLIAQGKITGFEVSALMSPPNPIMDKRESYDKHKTIDNFNDTIEWVQYAVNDINNIVTHGLWSGQSGWVASIKKA